VLADHRSCSRRQILDEAAAHAAGVGIANDGPQPGGGARIVQLADPDGNRVVLTGA
jgi:hypothetical protein